MRVGLWAALAVVTAGAAVAGAGFAFAPDRNEPVRIAPAARAAFQGARIPGVKPAPDFRLRTERGAYTRLSAARGKLVLLAFLYTRCTDVCPLIAVQLDSIVRSLGPRAGEVEVMAVSVDPKGDTQRAVREYMRSHRLGPQFHWLRGTRQELWPVWHDYNVAVAPGLDPGAVVHAAPILLVDRRGRLRVYFQQPHHPRVIAHDVRLLLRSAQR